MLMIIIFKKRHFTDWFDFFITSLIYKVCTLKVKKSYVYGYSSILIDAGN